MSPPSKTLLASLALAGFISFAQDTRNVTEPVFPPVCSQLQAQLTAGPTALPLASETLFDTARIQSALSACPAGQAVELQPGGSNNAFLIAPITLPNGVTLLVDAGVTVFASRNPRDYDADSSHSCGTIGVVNTGCVALITAFKVDGAGLMGYGTIDGRGQLPLLINGTPSATSWWDISIQAKAKNVNQNNPKLVQLNDANDFVLYKITLQNSPLYHVATIRSNNFTVWGIKIITPYDPYNTDGLNIGYSSNVTVTNCYISDGDDNVAVYASSPSVSNVSVVNNHFGDGHGASVGNYTQGNISNVLFDHISFAGDKTNNNQNGARIKSDVSDGGLVQNITYSNLCMQNVRNPIVIDPFYSSTATGNLIPRYQNITLRNVHATGEGSVKIEGHDATVPTTITLNNVQVDGVKSSDVTDQFATVTLGPDPVNFGSLLKGSGVTVANNVTTANPPYACPDAIFSPIGGELIPGPSQVAAAQGLSVPVQIFPTKAPTYQSYLTSLKTNPNATLALTAPTGKVTIYDGASPVGTAMLTGAPLISVPVSNLSVGSHTLTAAYSGDSNYAGITFGNYLVTVADHLASTTTLTASTTSASAGDSVTLSAAVASSSGTVPTSAVTFLSGDTALATAPLDSNGQASFQMTAVSGGSYSITAAYSGDAILSASVSAPVALTVNPVAATVTLVADSTEIATGQAVTLTAQVAPASSNPLTPTGTIQLVDGDSVLSTLALDPNGNAVYMTEALAAGSHSIVAAYSGDNNFVPATSSSVMVTVDAAPGAFPSVPKKRNRSRRRGSGSPAVSIRY